MGRSEIPVTRNQVSPKRAKTIRQAVQQATLMITLGGMARLAQVSDASALYNFLKDPAIHRPIYTLPRPLTLQTVERFILQHQQEQKEGHGLLFVSFDADGKLSGYTDLILWPDWAAGELSGAIRKDLQAVRRGIKGAAAGFTWMFETLGLDLICATAALDNIPTARLLDTLGFCAKGEITCYRPDGGTRIAMANIPSVIFPFVLEGVM